MFLCRNKNRELRHQFEISFQQTPWIVMLHKGHLHEYAGKPDDQEALIDFAISNFHDADVSRSRVPKIPTIWDELLDFWDYEVKHKGGVLNVMLMKNEEGRIHIGALFMVYGMPIATVYVFYLLMHYSFKVDGTESERTAHLEVKNAALKAKMDAWVEKHPALKRRHRKWE